MRPATLREKTSRWTAALSTACCSSCRANRQSEATLKNLILTGGVFHPFEESSQRLADIFAAAEVASEITQDVIGGIESLSSGDYDLLTVNALRWGMMTADKYEPYREEWAFQMPERSREALLRFVENGGRLLGMHTASICFDDWPEWGELLGGRWQWGISHHPPLGDVTVRATEREHPITEGIEAFTLSDEIYHNLALQPGVETLLLGDSPVGDAAQTIAWAHRVGDGRVVYDGLGHDAQSLSHPQHERLLSQAIRWLRSNT